MGYRKQKTEIDRVRQWDEFVALHAHAFDELQIPSIIFEREDRWRNFLHHGQMEMSEDLTQYQYIPPHSSGHETLVRLIERYFELRGRCISLWPGLLSPAEEQRFARQFATEL